MRNRLKFMAWMLVSIGLLALAGCGWGHHRHHREAAGCANCPMRAAQAEATKGADQQSDRRDILYVCDCGDQCQCNSMGVKAGNCACGKPMKGYHVLRTEGDTALLCTCGENCRCALDPNNPANCACGKPVKQVSLKGTGIYFCNCGGSCACNTLAAAPGQCRCGMPLKKID